MAQTVLLNQLNKLFLDRFLSDDRFELHCCKGKRLSIAAEKGGLFKSKKGTQLFVFLFKNKMLKVCGDYNLLVISSLIGFTLLGKYVMRLPFSSSKNFPKFHLISASMTPFSLFCVSHW